MVIARDSQVVQQGYHRHGRVEGGFRLGQYGKTFIRYHDSFHAEGDTHLGTLEHLLDGLHDTAVEPLLGEQVLRYLYRYLVNGFRGAFVLLPYVFQVAAYEGQVVVAQQLYVVANDASCPLAMLHEVQLVGIVLVQGVVEVRLVPLLQVVAVLLADRRYLNY